MDSVGSNQITLPRMAGLEGAITQIQNLVVEASQAQASKKKLGRPKVLAQQPLDISFSSEVWDYAGKYQNVKGYFFHQITDHFYGKCRSRLEHIIIWERIHAKEVPRNCYVHHRDLDRTNNNAENLMCIPVVLHLELHAHLRIVQKTLSRLAFEVERQRITKEYERKSAVIMEMWEILQGR